MSNLTVLPTLAIEKSTYVINVVIKDENLAIVTPLTLNWTLSDVNGDTVNGKEGEVVAVPAASNPVVLSGDDLAISGNAPTQTRVLTVEGTYPSIYGTLPFKESVRFKIENLKIVT